MKFSTTEDIDAPLDAVFVEVSDFETFERHGMRAGASVERADNLTNTGPGMQWEIKTDYRGKMRKIDLELTDFEPPQGLHFEAGTGGFDMTLAVELMALSKTKTRMHLVLDVRPTTLSARLLMQSARIAKTSLTKRFKSRVRNFGLGIEERQQKPKHA